tara:strand:+ start:353 stop:580 length:228 start_codon:yes stop_codon:yes gene_type:complete
MKHVQVQGHTNLVRDKRTGAILNTNRNEIARARKIKNIKNRETEVIKNLSQDVDTLKEDMKEIKELLFRLVEDKK